MKIQDALEPTGKAFIEKKGDCYAAIEDDGCPLTWYNKQTSDLMGHIALDTIISDKWQPYYEVKEIRPEKAGELWRYGDSDSYAHTFKQDDDIYFLSDGCAPKTLALLAGVKHGEYWTRLCPEVEDPSVKRIRIKDVTWHEGICNGVSAIFPRADNGSNSEDVSKDLLTRGLMNMILEIPKEA